ncbi:MAG TPA: DUF1328 domain-containing protein [Anaerolineae bacterium]|nr:DUF1328 domain-containing protein [Anaerolineae bacterium]
MLKWMIFLLFGALAAALFGLGGITNSASHTEHLLFSLYSVIFLASLILGLVIQR